MKLLAFIHAHLGDARGLFQRAMFFTFLEGLVTAGPVIAVALGLMRLAQGSADAMAMLPYAIAVVAAVALRILLIRLAWSSGFRAGNVATEDVVYLLHGMGIETGIDLDKLVDAGAFISTYLQRKPNSRAATALLNRRTG